MMYLNSKNTFTCFCSLSVFDVYTGSQLSSVLQSKGLKYKMNKYKGKTMVKN